MFFDHYPYTNFHNVNLDWVLQAVKAWGQTVKANDQAFKDLKEANESFKTYVRNYLQDLDVSDEINTKLDRMLAEGTLIPYFAPYVKGYVESWLASNVTPTTPALDKTLSLDDAAANAAATGERIERAAYLRTLDGPKLSNMLNKNLIIPGYRIQSACNAGGYFYVCGGSEAADGKGFIAKMSSLDFKDAEITYYTDLGHANDITYSYTTKRLYVTTVGEGVEWGIWNINPDDLTDKTLITNCPENTIGIQYVDGWVYVLAPPRIYRTLDFETYTLVINNTNEILNKFSIQSDDRISQTLVRLPNNVVGWVGSYIKEPEHIWYGFIAYFGSHGAITFDVFPTYHAECQAAIWDGKSTVYVISNGTTGPAYTVLRMDCGDLKYLELGAGKDLNDYTGEGLFYLIGAATMNNCPVNNEGLTLKVSRQGLLNTRQDIYTNSGRHLYRIKLFNAGTWGEWVEQAAEIAQIKEDLSCYNAYDVFTGKLTKTSGTSNGFTFTWDGDVCTVTGSATGYGANVLITNAALPSDIIPENTYFVKYSTTDKNVRLRIIWRKSDNTDIRTDLFVGDKSVTVPSTAEKWTVSLSIANTVTLESAVTVSDIAMLNTRSNAELLSLINTLSSDSFGARGIVADGTDLNTVKQPGYYVLQTNTDYTNSPLATGVAGILIVFPATANSIEQVVYSMGKPDAVKTYARSAILGNFSFAWKEVSGEQIVNEYVSQHYENTYNITATPTITTDTNNYLASTGDNTDRTGDIQTMLNTTGVCHLGPGKFVVTGVDIPDYSALIGSGDRTLVVLADSVTAGYAVKLNNYSTVYGLRINGGSTAQGTSSTVGTRHGILFEGTKQSGQTGGVTKKKSKIDKCTISNFSGGGIACTGTGVDLDSNLLISDCFVDHCGAGIYIPYYSEFHRVSNCAFTYNYYGCVDNGGNNNFVNCDFSGNKVGILIDNSNNQSPNVSHGSFSNCSVNHSYNDADVINEGTAIKLLKANLGEIFTGMQIFYGAVVLDDCVGIRFIGANVGSKVPITITDSSVVTFSDCTFKEDPAHADSTFTQSNNTVLKFTDCYLRDGTVYNPMSA